MKVVLPEPFMPPAPLLPINVLHFVAVLGIEIILISGNPAVDGFPENPVKQVYSVPPCNKK